MGLTPGTISLSGFREYEPKTTPEITSQAATLVTERFRTAADYASTAFNLALQQLGDLTGTGEIDIIDQTTPWIPNRPDPVEIPDSIAGLNLKYPTTPNITEILPDTIEFPYSPPTLDDVEIADIDIPDSNISLPNFLIPAAPTDAIPSFTDTAPVEETLNIPVLEELNLPPIPQLTQPTLPPEPVYETITFDGTRPSVQITPPDLTYIWNEAAYNSEARDALTTKLVDGIANGGLILPPDVEQAIYDRARDRLQLDLSAKSDDALNDFASRGAPVPQGALVSRLMEIERQNTQALTDLSRDVLIRSSEIAYQSASEMIARGLDLERLLTDHSNSIQTRAFEASKLVKDFAVKKFELDIEHLKAELTKYQIDAQVYEARIRGEISKAELYRSILASRELSLRMQELTMRLYEAQVNAIRIRIEIYNAKIEGLKAKSQLYGYRVEGYKAKVSAYEALIGAVTAKYNLYQAQVAGEAEKVKLYSEQVDAHNAVLEGFKVKSEIDVNRARFSVEKNDGKIKTFMALLDKHKAELQAATDKAEIQARNEGLKLSIYDGEIKTFATVADSLIESYKAKSQIQLGNAEVDIRYGELLARIETARAELKSSIAKAQGSIASQLAAAALTSVSAGASLNYGQHRSDGTSLNVSDSQSRSWSKQDSSSASISDSTIRQE